MIVFISTPRFLPKLNAHVSCCGCSHTISNFARENPRICGLSFLIFLYFPVKNKTHEPECSHVKHFCEINVNAWIIFQQPGTCVPCFRTSVDCGVWSGGKCRVGSVKRRVQKVECSV